jgi:hypothetical protein
MELFEDVNSDAAMSDTDVISFQGDTYPGSNEGDPVALVANTAVDKKKKDKPDTAATNHALLDEPDSNFTKCARIVSNIS